jgi:hypothetical protein
VLREVAGKTAVSAATQSDIGGMIVNLPMSTLHQEDFSRAG